MAVVASHTTSVYAEFDLGNLCAFNLTDLKQDKRSGETWLKDLATRGTQCLLEKIFQLPSEYQEHLAIAKLPEPSISLPREKPLPKKKPPTKWEAFAKKNNIKKKRRDNLTWDANQKDWKPRYGYRSAKNETKDWLVEVPNNADPNVDYFAKKSEEKTQNVAKNEYQRLKNIANTTKTKANNMESVDRANKFQLSQTISIAKSSTASLGKFTKKLPNEKPVKRSKKRQFQENIPKDIVSEKESNMKIFKELQQKKPKLDIKEAVQVNILKKQRPQKPGDNKRFDKPQKSKKSFNSKGPGKGGRFQKGGKFKKGGFGKNRK